MTTRAELDAALKTFCECRCDICEEYMDSNGEQDPVDCELYQAYEKAALAWAKTCPK